MLQRRKLRLVLKKKPIFLSWIKVTIVQYYWMILLYKFMCPLKMFYFINIQLFPVNLPQKSKNLIVNSMYNNHNYYDYHLLYRLIPLMNTFSKGQWNYLWYIWQWIKCIARRKLLANMLVNNFVKIESNSWCPCSISDNACIYSLD